MVDISSYILAALHGFKPLPPYYSPSIAGQDTKRSGEPRSARGLACLAIAATQRRRKGEFGERSGAS